MFVIGSLSSSEIGGMSVAPTQRLVTHIQYKEGKEVCFPLFPLSVSPLLESAAAT